MNLLKEISVLTDKVDGSNEKAWYDMFVEYFVSRKDSFGDDLLYLVHRIKDSEKDGDQFGISVHRKGSPSSLQYDNVSVEWQKTVLVNLITQQTYQLRLCIVGQDGLVRTCQVSPIFGDPVRTKHVGSGRTGVKCSYPNIVFALHGDETPLCLQHSDTLCVELVALLTDPHSSQESISGSIEIEEGSKYYGLSNEDPNIIILFQGSVAFSVVRKTYEGKTGILGRERQKITMRAPNGIGVAQFQLTSIQNSKLDHENMFKRRLNRLKEKLFSIDQSSPSTPNTHSTPIYCNFQDIQISWQLIIHQMNQYS